MFTPDEKLNPTENIMLRLYSEGNSFSEIAVRLCTPVDTVKETFARINVKSDAFRNLKKYHEEHGLTLADVKKIQQRKHQYLVHQAKKFTMLPCPFCGREASCTSNNDGKGYKPYCASCGCTIDRYYEYKTDAVRAWNRRDS